MVREDLMAFPTIEEVEAASHEQLAKWYRFLVNDEPSDKERKRVMKRLSERIHELGGMTPELSNKIGWDSPRKKG